MHRDSKIKNVSIPTDKRSRQLSKSDDYAADLFNIKRVLEAYESCITLPTLSTLILNDDGDMQGQRVLLPASSAIEFIVDVERITERSLIKPELQDAWFQLLSGEQIATALEHGLVKALGKKYRVLAPFKYFRQIRRGSVDAQKRAA